MIVVSASLSGSHRKNAIGTKTGAKSIPSSAAPPATVMRIPSTAPANRPASSSRPSSRNSAYTGITEALSVPSPKRFWITLGILVAATQTSIRPDTPKNEASSTLRMNPLIRLKKNARAHRKGGAGASGGSRRGISRLGHQAAAPVKRADR